jgi:uncharacterized protein YdeI (YjbR/CyaY-like superfamily)
VPQVKLHSSPVIKARPVKTAAGLSPFTGFIPPVRRRPCDNVTTAILMAKSSVKTFKATLKSDSTSLKWTVVSVPRSITDQWKTGRPRVKGEINGFPFRTSLFSTGKSDFILLVNRKMQAGAKVVLGSVAEFRLEPDAEERIIAVPAELKAAMKGAAALRRYYDELPYSARKYISDLVTAAKSPEARARQAERLAEVTFAMLEGERETPPILQAAFVRTPQAKKGWELMTPVQRRGHLWGIFYYKSPESRQKRAAKAIEEAIRIAKAKGKPATSEENFDL